MKFLATLIMFFALLVSALAEDEQSAQPTPSTLDAECLPTKQGLSLLKQAGMGALMFAEDEQDIFIVFINPANGRYAIAYSPITNTNTLCLVSQGERFKLAPQTPNTDQPKKESL